MNKNKFKIELVWHNCYEYPPAEAFNDNLVATDGKRVFKVKYDKNVGWFDLDNVRFLPFEMLCDYWWADIIQTVRNCSDF